MESEKYFLKCWLFLEDGTGTFIKVDLLPANNIGPILHPGVRLSTAQNLMKESVKSFYIVSSVSFN